MTSRHRQGDKSEKMGENILISFFKQEFNKKTEDFLCSKLDESVDGHLIEYIRRLSSSKKLMAKEALELISAQLKSKFVILTLSKKTLLNYWVLCLTLMTNRNGQHK